MKVKITTNGGHDGILDTETGVVTWLSEPPQKPVDVGYVHLADDHHGPEEIEAIKNFNIRYFANHSILKSATPMIDSGTVKRDWRPGEKKVELQKLRDTPVENPFAENLEGAESPLWRILAGEAFESQEEKDKAIKAVEDRNQTTESRDDLVTHRLSLGASFQRYYTDNLWLKDAGKIKGSRIYLA